MLLGVPKRTLIVVALLVGVGLMVMTGGAEKIFAGFKGGPCRFTVSADTLNVRGAPARQAPLVDTVAQGEELRAYPVVKNGFRMVSETRWAADEFLTKVEGSVCV